MDTGVTDLLAGLRPAQRRELLRAAGGDLDRVTVEADGGWTVWNTPAAAQRARAGGAPATQGVPQAADKRALPGQRKRPARVSARGGAVLSMRTRVPDQLLAAEADAPAVDWTAMGLGAAAAGLLELCQAGLPRALSFDVPPDAMAGERLTLADVVPAVRSPQRVVISPQTFARAAPVLAFHRGACVALVAFTRPTAPVVVQAYRRALAPAGRPGAVRQLVRLPALTAPPAAAAG